jgi:hypothetical protein
MKNYCTQNQGVCTTCSLNNYGRDCNNIEIDSIIDSVSRQDEINAILSNIKFNIDRIELCGLDVLTDQVNIDKMITLQKISGQLQTLNIL